MIVGKSFQIFLNWVWHHKGLEAPVCLGKWYTPLYGVFWGSWYLGLSAVGNPRREAGGSQTLPPVPVLCPGSIPGTFDRLP